MSTDAGWLPDPIGAHQMRYWDGSRWTEHVSDGGTAAFDPLPAEWRQVTGGVLVQLRDRIDADGDDPANWRLATGEAADEATLRDLAFAWRAVRAVKSNAILLARGAACASP